MRDSLKEFPSLDDVRVWFMLNIPALTKATEQAEDEEAYRLIHTLTATFDLYKAITLGYPVTPTALGYMVRLCGEMIVQWEEGQ